MLVNPDTPASASSPPAPPPRRLATPALFAVDSAGVIQSVNAAAVAFWLGAETSLVGAHVTSLLTPYPIRETAPPLQWELLRSSALNRSITCAARMPDRFAIDVTARIEEARGADVSYFVWAEDPIQRHDSAPPLLVDSGLALVTDQGAVGFFDLNFKVGQVYYSPAWKRALGFAESELANTYDSWLRLLHPDDSAAAPDHAARRKVRGARTFNVEVRMRHRSGHYVWVHCIGTQVYGPRGDLERVTGIQIDISERKEIEEQSLVNEERLQRLTAESELALFDLNFATQQFWLSSGWCKLIGAPEAAGLMALNQFVDALPPELAMRGAQSFFVEPHVGQASFLTPLVLRRVDGTGITTLFGAHRQLSRKGDLQRAVGFCCPLPPQIAEYAATPFAASLVDTVIASFSEAIIVADGRGVISYVNSRAERLLAAYNDKLRGQNLDEVFRLLARRDASPVEGALDAALASPEESRMYADHMLVPVGESGVPCNIVWAARRINSSDGATSGILIVFRNPEEMSLTPEELLKINRFENLGIVAGGISHDFNNLLTTILGGISHAKDNGDPRFLPDSERACLAAKALTKQLLAFARGGKTEAIQTLSVLELMRDAARLARAGTAAEIRIDVPDTVSPLSVDRAQILQVFQNLIINALQALPAHQGTVWLSGSHVELAEEIPGLRLIPGSYVRIDVRDNGSGIAPEHLEKIFEPFFTTKKNGTGLGLPMVRSIVRRYSGDVAVESTVGKGTTFQVYLPQAKSKVETTVERRAPTLRFGTGRILLMDDDPDICRLTEGMLESLEYICDIARNGEEALVLYRKTLNIGRPYDAVILDLTVVGGSGGEETFHRLREMDKDVRAIVCSGYDNDDMIQHFKDLGFVGYLTKPFRVGDLGRAVKEAIGS